MSRPRTTQVSFCDDHPKKCRLLTMMMTIFRIWSFSSPSFVQGIRRRTLISLFSVSCSLSFLASAPLIRQGGGWRWFWGLCHPWYRSPEMPGTRRCYCRPQTSLPLCSTRWSEGGRKPLCLHQTWLSRINKVNNLGDDNSVVESNS